MYHLVKTTIYSLDLVIALIGIKCIEGTECFKQTYDNKELRKLYLKTVLLGAVFVFINIWIMIVFKKLIRFTVLNHL